MKHFYPLCAAERLQDHKILEYNRPQEVNICVCMTIRAGVDFGLLKHCIQMEYARQESLRIRFTARDEHGKVFQYLTHATSVWWTSGEKRRRKSTQRWRNGPVNLLSRWIHR